MAGPNQKSSSKKPLDALDGSNYARGGAGMEVDAADPAKCGYTTMPYPVAGPAQTNDAIRNTRSSVGSLGNDGTSRNSYRIQPDIVDAENPESGSSGTGNGKA